MELPAERDLPVVVMAGGLGSRLAPLTGDCPKPMLRIGSRPILETILESLLACSFRTFYFAVHYKAEMIEHHFGDGSRFGANIRYLRESCQLGTAGALSLLPERPRLPLLVVNGDLLTKTDYSALLQAHCRTESVATMGVVQRDIPIHYGVVRSCRGDLLGIDEKPLHRISINAGIYMLQPEALDYIPLHTRTDMTALFDRMLRSNCKLSVHPIGDYWLDIGNPHDLAQAQLDFKEWFS